MLGPATLGGIAPPPAGELGTLELGELLGEELVVECEESDDDLSLLKLPMARDGGDPLPGSASDWKLRLGASPVGVDTPPLAPPPDTSCWMSALARLLLNRRSSDARRFLSLDLGPSAGGEPWSLVASVAAGPWEVRRWRVFRRARRLVVGLRLRPPARMEVLSSGVVRMWMRLPPARISCSTCGCSSPWTASPLMCVIRSPGRRPASKAGLLLSTAMTRCCTV